MNNTFARDSIQRKAEAVRDGQNLYIHHFGLGRMVQHNLGTPNIRLCLSSVVCLYTPRQASGGETELE